MHLWHQAVGALLGPESRHGHNVHLPAERRTIP